MRVILAWIVTSAVVAFVWQKVDQWMDGRSYRAEYQRLKSRAKR